MLPNNKTENRRSSRRLYVTRIEIPSRSRLLSLGMVTVKLRLPFEVVVIARTRAIRKSGLESHANDPSSVTAIWIAAVSAVATNALAKRDASNLTILGSRTQASMHLDGLVS